MQNGIARCSGRQQKGLLGVQEDSVKGLLFRTGAFLVTAALLIHLMALAPLGSVCSCWTFRLFLFLSPVVNNTSRSISHV